MEPRHPQGGSLQFHKVAYEDCQHLRTDNPGSDRNRVYCLDCCRIIDETPQTLHKESLALAQKVPTQQQDLTRRQLQEYTFSQFEAGKVVKTFFKQMDKYLVNKESVTSTELSRFLEDAMDSVVEGRERVPRLAYSEAAPLATAAASSSAALGSGHLGPLRARLQRRARGKAPLLPTWLWERA